MPSRHRSRRRALQILFEHDMRGGDIDQAIAHYYSTLYTEESGDADVEPDPFTEQLVRGTVQNRAEIDRTIEARSAHWKLSRMPVVDRNILRLAIYEMSLKAVAPVIVIDEALELARQFSSDESLAFINGVLDAINKQSTASA